MRVLIRLTAPRQRMNGRKGVVRCVLDRGLLRGQSGLMQLRLLLTQHPLAGAASSLRRYSQGRHSGHAAQLDGFKSKQHFR